MNNMTDLNRKQNSKAAASERALKSTRIYNWVNLIAYVAMVTVNILANALPLGGNTSGQVSDRYPSLFTPAGITFSIWGVIYALLGIVMVRQLISKREGNAAMTQNIGILFTVSCVLNIGWIFSWHFGMITGSTLLILALLITLILINVLVREDMLMKITFGIYFAWIMVASVASIFVNASALGADLINRTGEVLAAIAVIFSGGVLLTLTMLGNNWEMALVGIWAYIGIIVRQSSQYSGHYALVIGSAVTMLIVLTAGIGYSLLRKKEITFGQSPSGVPD